MGLGSCSGTRADVTVAPGAGWGSSGTMRCVDVQPGGGSRWRLVPWIVFGVATVVSGGIVAFHVSSPGGPATADVTHFFVSQALLCWVLGGLGALIIRRQPGQPVGIFLVGVGMATGLSGLGREYVVFGGRDLLPGSSWVFWLSEFLWFPAYALVPTLLLVVFPDGRPPSRRWWPICIAAVTVVMIDVVWFALTPFPREILSALPGLRHPLGRVGEPRSLEEVFGLWPAVSFVVLLGCVTALLVRLARSHGTRRRQLQWFAAGSLLWIGFLLVDALTHISDNRPLVETAFFLLPPLGAAIGIVRHNLFDLDRVLHRGMASGAFAAAAGAVYAAVVLLAQRVVGARQDLVISAIAVAAVAVAALPVWRQVNQWVERLLYGQRTEPFEVLGRITAELEAAVAPHVLLERVAAGLATSLRLPSVRLAVNGWDPVQVGEERAPTTSLPLTTEGTQVGTLVVGHRSETEAFSTQEQRLLEDLAGRVATAARSFSLAADLQRSREQLVLAREEERRRIRRDLHDGLGPQLAGISLQIDMSRELLTDDPDRVLTLLNRAKDELTDAVLAVRNVVDGLRPPSLDELGLIGAIRQQVTLLDTSLTGGLDIRVVAPTDLGPLPAATEVAAFRIVTEAVTNAARHANATTCTIEVRGSDVLEIEVRDDGSGLRGTGAAGSGVGFGSMQTRAEELGGKVRVESTPGSGTCITARLPRT